MRHRFEQVESDPRWRKGAACNQSDPETFFAGTLFTNKAAQQICGHCPIREACLTWALDNPTAAAHGIWGGLRPDERQKILRRRRTRPEEEKCT